MNELKRVIGDFVFIEISFRVFVVYIYYRMMFLNSINVIYFIF